MPPPADGAALGATGSVMAPSRPHAATTRIVSAAFHMLFIRNEPLREMGPNERTENVLRCDPAISTREMPPETRGFADRPRGRGALVRYDFPARRRLTR